MISRDTWAQIARHFPEAKILQWDKGKRLVLKCESHPGPEDLDRMFDTVHRLLGENLPGPVVILSPGNIDWHIGKENTPLEYALGQRIRQLEAHLRAHHIPIPQDPVT